MALYSVAIVDDNHEATEVLQSCFVKEDFTTLLAYEGYEALRLIKEKKPDIVILNLMLPGMNGWEVCKTLRKESSVPILMLPESDTEFERLTSLEIGADDYVTKPFSPREVVARAKAILRRTGRRIVLDKCIQIGDLVVDVERHFAQKNKLPLRLTPTEFKILDLLVNNLNRVFSRLQIVEYIQGHSFEGYERTIDAHIKNLRRKVEDNTREPKYIQTVYGVGYKFGDDYLN